MSENLRRPTGLVDGVSSETEEGRRRVAEQTTTTDTQADYDRDRRIQERADEIRQQRKAQGEQEEQAQQDYRRRLFDVATGNDPGTTALEGLRVTGPRDFEAEDRTAYEQETTPLGRGLRSAGQNLLATVPATESLIRGIAGDEEGAQRAAYRARDRMDQAAELGNFTSLQGVVEGEDRFSEWLAGAVGQQIPNLALFIGGGGVGGLAARAGQKATVAGVTQGVVNPARATAYAATGRAAAQREAFEQSLRARAVTGTASRGPRPVQGTTTRAAVDRAEQRAIVAQEVQREADDILRQVVAQGARREQIGAGVGAGIAGVPLFNNDASQWLIDPEAEGTIQERALLGLTASGLASSASILPTLAVLRNVGLGATAVRQANMAAMSGLRRVPMETGKQAVLEGSAEVASELIMTAGHAWVNDNINIMSSDQLWRYMEAGVLGAGMGGTLGGATAVRGRDFKELGDWIFRVKEPGPNEMDIIESSAEAGERRNARRSAPEIEEATILYESLDEDTRAQISQQEFVEQAQYGKSLNKLVGAMFDVEGASAENVGFTVRTLVDPEYGQFVGANVDTPNGSVSVAGEALRRLGQMFGEENVAPVLQAARQHLIEAEQFMLRADEKVLNTQPLDGAAARKLNQQIATRRARIAAFEDVQAESAAPDSPAINEPGARQEAMVDDEQTNTAQAAEEGTRRGVADDDTEFRPGTQDAETNVTLPFGPDDRTAGPDAQPRSTEGLTNIDRVGRVWSRNSDALRARAERMNRLSGADLEAGPGPIQVVTAREALERTGVEDKVVLEAAQAKWKEDKSKYRKEQAGGTADLDAADLTLDQAKAYLDQFETIISERLPDGISGREQRRFSDREVNEVVLDKPPVNLEGHTRADLAGNSVAVNLVGATQKMYGRIDDRQATGDTQGARERAGAREQAEGGTGRGDAGLDGIARAFSEAVAELTERGINFPSTIRGDTVVFRRAGGEAITAGELIGQTRLSKDAAKLVQDTNVAGLTQNRDRLQAALKDAKGKEQRSALQGRIKALNKRIEKAEKAQTKQIKRLNEQAEGLEQAVNVVGGAPFKGRSDAKLRAYAEKRLKEIDAERAKIKARKGSSEEKKSMWADWRTEKAAWIAVNDMLSTLTDKQTDARLTRARKRLARARVALMEGNLDRAYKALRMREGAQKNPRVAALKEYLSNEIRGANDPQFSDPNEGFVIFGEMQQYSSDQDVVISELENELELLETFIGPPTLEQAEYIQALQEALPGQETVSEGRSASSLRASISAVEQRLAALGKRKPKTGDPRIEKELEVQRGLMRERIKALKRIDKSLKKFNETYGQKADEAAQPAQPAQSGKPVNVWHSSKENAQLSNLAARPFTDSKGRKYVSVEHAYQTWKSGAFDQATYAKYKGAGRKIPGRKGTKTENNWNVKLMERLMRLSFEQNADAKQALLDTGNAPITHRQDRGIWAKEFPRILTKLRGEFQSDTQPAQTDATPTVKPDAPIAKKREAVERATDRASSKPSSTQRENEVQYAQELVNGLNMKDVTVNRVLSQVEAAQRAKEKGLDIAQHDGLVFQRLDTKTGKLEVDIWVDEQITDPAERIGVLHHELGHAVVTSMAYQLNVTDAAQVMQAYNMWRATARGKDVKYTLKSKRSFLNMLTARGSDTRMLESLSKGERENLLDFQEWFADNVGRWFETNKRPQGVIEKFFKAIADRLKKLMGINKNAGLPDATVASVLNRMWDSKMPNGHTRKYNLWQQLDRRNALDNIPKLDSVIEEIQKQFKGIEPKRAHVGGMAAATRPNSIEALHGVRDYIVGKMSSKEREKISRVIQRPSVQRQLSMIRTAAGKKGLIIESDALTELALAYMAFSNGKLDLEPNSAKPFRVASQWFHELAGMTTAHEQAYEVLSAMEEGVFLGRTTLLHEQAKDGSHLNREHYVLESAQLQTLSKWNALYDFEAQLDESGLDNLVNRLLNSRQGNVFPPRIKRMVANDIKRGTFTKDFLNQFKDESDFVLNPEKTFLSTEIVGTEPLNNAARAVYNVMSGIKQHLRNNLLGRGALGESYRGRMTENLGAKKLMEALFTDIEQEGAGEGFINRKDRMIGSFATEWEGIWADLSNEDQLNFRDAFYDKSVQPRSTEVRQALLKTNRFMRKMHKYAGEVGLLQGSRFDENYRPWAFDAGKVDRQSSKLVETWTHDRYRKHWFKLLKEHYPDAYGDRKDFKNDQEYQSYVRAWIASIAFENGFADAHRPSPDEVNTQPVADSLNRRELAFLDEPTIAPAADRQLLSSLFDDSVNTTMAKYVAQMVKKVEYARKFGAKDEKLNQMLAQARELGATHADVELLTNMMKSATGRQGLEVATFWKKVAEPINKLAKPVRDTNGQPFPDREAAMRHQRDKGIDGTVEATPGGFEIKKDFTADPRRFRQKMSWVVVYQNWRLLALAALTNVADLAGITFRTGNLPIAFEAYKEGVGRAFKEAKGMRGSEAAKRAQQDSVTRLAMEMGVISHAAVSEHLGLQYGSVHMTGTAKRWNDTLFKLNGMEFLTRHTRTMAVAAGRRYLSVHGLMATQGEAKSTEALLELGIEAGDIKLDRDGELRLMTLDEVNAALEDSKFATGVGLNEAIDGGYEASATELEVARDDRVKRALSRMVDESVLRPATWQRPTWMNDPNWQIFSHLKGFMYTYHERVLRRITSKGAAGAMAPLVLAMGYVGVMMAADALRELVQHGPEGDDRKERWGFSERLTDGVHRSGLMGMYTIIPDMMKTHQFGRSLLAQMGGPATSQVEQIYRAMFGTGQIDTAFKRALPASQVVVDPMASWGSWVVSPQALDEDRGTFDVPLIRPEIEESFGPD